MVLGLEQIREIVKKPNTRLIQRSIAHSDRLKFHSEPVINASDLGGGYSAFLKWVGEEQPEILPKHAFIRFKQFLTCPIETTELTERIYTSLYRVFHSKNSSFVYNFTDDSLNAIWDERRDKTFYSKDVWGRVKTSIDSFLCFNLPVDQSGEYPEPFRFFVDPHMIIDSRVNKDGLCEYLIFKYGDKIVVYDDASIVEFSIIDGELGNELARFDHGLGCLARPIWTDSLESTNYFLKRSPITNNLGRLDWLLFMKTNKKYMDTFNSYPITKMYETDNDVTDTNRGRESDDKVTSKSSLTAPGAIIGVPIPRSGESDLMQNAVGFVSPPIDGLNYHVTEEERLVDYIFKSTVGYDDESSKSAMNEKQVYSTFEGRKDVLLNIAKNLEQLQTWADSMECKLIFDSSFISCSICYGTEFYLEDEDEILYELKEAKDNNAPDAIISSLQYKAIDTRYRNDSYEKQRALIINDLDPFPTKNIQELEFYANKNAISLSDLQLKANLINFVSRFEREMGIDIVNWGSKMDYNKKIQEILNEFKSYENPVQSGPAI